jgi:hypothetical protein
MKEYTQIISACRNCPRVRKAIDQQNFCWYICPDLMRIVATEPGNAEIPADCPLPDE